MGRPKSGRKYYSHSVSLTREQIEFLSKFPNSSEMLRKLIGDLMILHGEIEPKLSIIALRHEIELIEQQKSKLLEERRDYVGKHWLEMYKEHFKEDPIDTPDAEYHRKIVKGYDEAVEAMESKIKELKKRAIKES